MKKDKLEKMRVMFVPENFNIEIINFEINPTIFLGSWVPQNISP